MTSIARLGKIMRTLFVTRANEVARQTGFVVRQRKITGASFLQGLVFGWLHQPQARLEQLARVLSPSGMSISASGLHQRFTPQAAAFLQAMLSEVVQQVVCVSEVPIELMQRFTAVIVEDSTQITLPDGLKTLWRGCGGGGSQSQAAIKLHVRWDLLRGSLQGPIVTEARTADQRSPLRLSQGIPAGGLLITDEGYFGLQWLKEQTRAGDRFFLTRPRTTTGYLDQSFHCIDLLDLGPQEVGTYVDEWVWAGFSARLPARLIMIRVPDDVAEERARRLWADRQRHGQEPSERDLALTKWTIYLTNVPKERLSVPELLVLARARWQIERLFRLWKQDGLLDEWRTCNLWRIQCELFAKLIALVVQHWLLIQQTWQDPYRSLVKAAKVVRDHAAEVIEVLQHRVSFPRFLQRLGRDLRQGCQVDRRAKKPCQAQLFLNGLDWPLYEVQSSP